MKIIKTLILVRLRRWVAREDYLTMSFICILYLTIPILFNDFFLSFRRYLLFTTFEVLFYHTNRKDLELLRLNKNSKIVLLIEYSIYSLPYFIFFLYNSDFLSSVILFLILILIIYIPKIKNQKVNYPFDLFYPFWHISFRKNKLFLIIPVAVFVFIMGVNYNNQNLKVIALLLNVLIGTIPSFSRESIEHIKDSFYTSSRYLLQQIKITLKNSAIVVLPISICLIIFKEWNLFIFIPVFFLIPIYNILLKYSFFYNSFLHQIVFAISIITFYYGIPLITFPFFYKKANKFLRFTNDV